MAFRDDLGAAQARADALEQQVAELEQENERLRTGARSAGDERVAKHPSKAAMLVPIVIAALGVAGIGVLFQEDAALVISGVLGVSLLVMGITLVSLLEFIGPQEIGVISGRQYPGPGGVARSYRVVHEGRVVLLPIVERIERMTRTPFPTLVEVNNAYVAKGIPVRVTGNAEISIHATDPLVQNAIERFLGRGTEEIARVAQETLEGVIRACMAKLTIDTLQQNREAFAAEVIEESQSDLDKLGIDLKRFTIDSVTANAP